MQLLNLTYLVPTVIQSNPIYESNAADRQYYLSAVPVYKHAWSMSEWRFINEWVMTGRGWARAVPFGRGTAQRGLQPNWGHGGPVITAVLIDRTAAQHRA